MEGKKHSMLLVKVFTFIFLKIKGQFLVYEAQEADSLIVKTLYVLVHFFKNTRSAQVLG